MPFGYVALLTIGSIILLIVGLLFVASRLDGRRLQLREMAARLSEAERILDEYATEGPIRQRFELYCSRWRA